MKVSLRQDNMRLYHPQGNFIEYYNQKEVGDRFDIIEPSCTSEWVDSTLHRYLVYSVNVEQV